MKIQPTDWVWFTYKGSTQFGEFSYLQPELQHELERIFKRDGKTYNMFNPNKYLWLHMILPKEGSKYAKKLHFLFKGANKPNFDITSLSGGNHWLYGESPKFGPIASLNDDLGYSGKKRLYLQYVDWLCKFIVIPEPPTFKESKVNKHWDKHENEIKNLLQSLKNKQERLEEKPMKVKQYLIELSKYNREKKEVTDEKEFLLVKCDEKKPMLATDIFLTLESIYVNIEDHWNLLHGILSIGDGYYKVGSGNIEYNEDRLKMSKEGILEEINFARMMPNKVYYTEKDISPSKEGVREIDKEIYIKLPLKYSIKNVIKYYQAKYPSKNYRLNRRSVKKELSERSKKVEGLPKIGETPEKDLRKVCYKKKDGDKIFRGQFKEVKKLVDSGDYEYAPKAAFKSQTLNKDGSVLIQGVAYKTNITQPLTKGKELGTRKEKREKRDNDKQLKIVRSLKERYIRQAQRKPGYAESKLQSEKDKQQYAEKRKSTKKQRASHPQARAYEVVILGDKSEVLATLNIKATSNTHAEKILKSIMKNKGKNAKLTGNVREWIKQTGNVRPENRKEKKAGTKKPKQNRVSSS